MIPTNVCISSTVNGAEVAFSGHHMHSILNATCVTIAVSACMRLLYLLCPYSANQYQTQKTVRLHLLIIKQNILNISQFANHFINLYHETQNEQSKQKAFQKSELLDYRTQKILITLKSSSAKRSSKTALRLS